MRTLTTTPMRTAATALAVGTFLTGCGAGGGGEAGGGSASLEAILERDLDVTGTWDTFDDLVLVQDGRDVTGQYQGAAIVEGELRDGVLTGFYFNPEAEECDEERDGKLSWGTIEFVFNESGTAFEGLYGRCDEELGREWNGSLLDGASFTPIPVVAELPLTTRYGFLEVTLISAGVAPGVSSQTPLRERLEDDEIALVVDVSIKNLNPELEWSIPHSSLFWAELNDELWESLSKGTISLEPGKTEAATIVLGLPGDADPSLAKLWLQESALDFDNRTRPAFMGMDGSVDEPFDEIVISTFQNGAPDPGCRGTYVYEKWVLDDNAGFKDNGAPAWGTKAGLGRALNDGLLLTTFAKATRDSTTCKLQVHPITPKAIVDGAPVDPQSKIAASVYGWTEAPTEDIWSFYVPQDLRSFEIENMEDGFGANGWVTTATATATAGS